MIIIILLALALIGLIYFIYNTPATEESADNGTAIINVTTMKNPTTTSFVAVGYDAGPKKLEKIKERQEKGQAIEVIDEDRLLEILESVGL